MRSQGDWFGGRAGGVVTCDAAATGEAVIPAAVGQRAGHSALSSAEGGGGYDWCQRTAAD
jgi:hypothetical protein